MKTRILVRILSLFCWLSVLVAFANHAWAQDPQVSLSLRGRWPGYQRGSVLDVAVLGQYAFLAIDKAEVLILDVNTPAQPTWRKSLNVGASPTAIAIAGNRLYVARWGAGLAILDIAQPLDPVPLGALEVGYNSTHSPYGIQVVGDYAYLMWWDNNYSTYGLDVVDIRNPAQPVRTGSVEIPAQTWDFQVRSTHAYVASGDGLWIVDVSNPLQPVLAGAYQTNRWFWGVALYGPYVCVAMKDVRLVVLDVSNPVNPTPVDTYLGEAGAWSHQHWVQVAGNYAYVLTDHDLEVLDISDPTRILRAGELRAELPGRFQVAGNYGYFATGLDGLQVINLADPLKPAKAGGFDTGGHLSATLVQVVGSRAYLADMGALQILDVGDPARPARMGSVEFAAEILGAAVEALAVVEPYVYVTGSDSPICCTNAFSVFDVSNPAAPARVGQQRPFDTTAFQIREVGDCACIAGVGSEENLMLIDVSNRSQPVRKPGFLLGGHTSISVAGQYLYVASANYHLTKYGEERFFIVDVSSPGNPVLAARALTQGEGGGVDVAGHYAYVAVNKGNLDTLNGLEVFDISNPAMPVSVGTCEGGLWTRHIQVQDHYAYLSGELRAALDQTWLEVINLKDPTQPRLVGRSKLWDGDPRGYGSDSFQVVGNLIYVADGAWGLTIMEIELPGTLKLKPPVLSGNTITLTWNGGPSIKLQKTTSLSALNWQDVSGSEGLSQIELPCAEAAAFFRLMKP